MLGMVAMLASCSQDELGGARTDGALTITATVDNGIGTRASTYDSDDVDIDECLLEVYDAEGSLVGSQLTGTPGGTEGTFTFTVSGLDPDAQYDFVFWADSKAAATYGGSLKERKLTDAADLTKALAFQGRIDNSRPADATAVTLTHAVAKVTLKTTGAMTTGDNVTLAMTGIADTWNVQTGTATGTAAKTYAYTLTADIAQPQTDAEVTTFYVPAPALGSTSDITLSYANASGSKQGSTSVTNVPLQANYRTVLKGDVAALFGGATATITASLDGDWNDQSGESVFPQTNTIETTGVGQITAEAVKAAAAIGNGTVIINGQINEADLQTIAAITDTKINLDLSQATLMNSDGTGNITEFPAAFQYNANTQSTSVLTGIILPSGIESLADNCFQRCVNLTSVTLPEGLKTIGSSAFQNTGITSIDFPASLETINGYAFSGSKLEGELVIPEHVTFPSNSPSPYATTTSVFSETNITSVVWNSPSPLQNHTFSSCKQLKTVTINDCGGIHFNAFGMGCTVSELIINMTTPPTIDSHRGEGFNSAEITSIKVPAEAVDTYQAADGWSYYDGVITAIE